jgi:microcystin-dependent protein
MPWLTGGKLPASGDVFCRQLRIPNDLAFIQAVNGALMDLTQPENWEQFGIVTPEEAAAAMFEMYLAYLDSTCMIGTIIPYATLNPPANCLPCDGSIYPAINYPKLAAALDPIYEVPPDHFRTPDLRDVFVLGAGVTHLTDSKGGAETVALTPEQNGQHTHTAQPHGHTSPPHSHTAQPHSHTSPPHSHTSVPHSHTESAAAPLVTTVGLEPPEPTALPAPGVTGPSTVIINPATAIINAATIGIDQTTATIDEETVVIDDSGAGEAHENMPPFVALPYCIVAK